MRKSVKTLLILACHARAMSHAASRVKSWRAFPASGNR